MNFLRCRISESPLFIVALVQFILGRNDVFDGGTVLGFLQRQGIYQYLFVWDGPRNALQLGQSGAGRSQLFQHLPGFEHFRFLGGW